MPAQDKALPVKSRAHVPAPKNPRLWRPHLRPQAAAGPGRWHRSEWAGGHGPGKAALDSHGVFVAPQAGGRLGLALGPWELT